MRLAMLVLARALELAQEDHSQHHPEPPGGWSDTRTLAGCLELPKITPFRSLVPHRERRGGTRPELEEKSPRRVAFDWATRRKPLAGRTLWMLEPALVLLGRMC
jgi:hypothetical protein